ncbi:tetratricopeptide repeat protein [Actinokineospora cianjurensis]|nr:tetratricopeptide repeat protein [Actinokineospora cianjurensis]
MTPDGKQNTPPEGVWNEARGVRDSRIVQVGHATINVVSTPSGVAQIPDPHSWPLVSGWTPLASGVHRAKELPGGDIVPPYVERDVDADLREKISNLGDGGGWVLLLGHSATGKTRAAFEAIRAVLPQHRVATPLVSADLAPILDAVTRSGFRCVLWLDDLDESLLGPGGLNENLLTEFRRQHVVVVATMRIQRLKTFAPSGHVGISPSLTQAVRLGARVLEMAEAIEVPRLWSGDELRRAGEHSDERIVDAVAHHGIYGVAEYLAAGPAIWAEWRRAIDVEGQPRGAALVAAAVDLERCGLPGPYHERLITGLHEHYLEAYGGHVLRPEPLPDAWEWAAKRRYGVTSPLLPVSPTHWKVFDYLVDSVERITPSPAVPDVVWDQAVEHATGDQLMNIAVKAAETGTEFSRQIAEAIWRPMVADSLDGALATYNLGVLCMETSRADEGRELFVQAAAAGEPMAAYNLGALHEEDGDKASARKWILQAVQMNYPPAFFSLGFDLEEQGKIEEAEIWYRRGAELGEHRSATNLGKILSSAGRVDEAMPWFILAHEAGDRYAAFNIGLFHHEAGRYERAEHWYRVALERGVAEAAMSLGTLRVRVGDRAGAEEWFTQAADAGVQAAFGSAGTLSAVSGDLGKAEAWFRAGAEHGDLTSIRGMGFLLNDAGRFEDAALWLERGAALDDHVSIDALGQVLHSLGRVDEAIPYLEKAAEMGVASAMFNLGVIYANRRDLAESARWYRMAADSGDAEAAINLADVMFHDGRVASAVWWARRSRVLRAEAG